MTVRLDVYPLARPKTRGECADMPRPCPFVSCKWHLVHMHSTKRAEGEDGQLFAPVMSRPDSDDSIVESIEAMEHSCVLDIADAGPHSRSRVASMVGVDNARLRKLESPVREPSQGVLDLLASLEDVARHDVTMFAETD